jgi:zinc protease
MFQFFPNPNLGRKAQLFEVWIRPVAPENAHMALRIALYELDRLLERGLTPAQFEATREYLMKNVFVMTATQDQALGYALDSQWYGVPEFTRLMRDALSGMTVDQVNAAMRKHLSAKNLSVVMIAKDASDLRQRLLSDAPSTVKYDAAKPKVLLDEDAAIGQMKLNLKPDNVRITPVSEVFAR